MKSFRLRKILVLFKLLILLIVSGELRSQYSGSYIHFYSDSILPSYSVEYKSKLFGKDFIIEDAPMAYKGARYFGIGLFIGGGILVYVNEEKLMESITIYNRNFVKH